MQAPAGFAKDVMDESHNFPPMVQEQRKTGWRLWLALVLIAFALGGATTFLMLRDAAPGSAISDLFDVRREADPALATGPLPSPSATETASIAEAREAVDRVEEVVQQQGGLDARLAAMEQRLTRLDMAAEAAAGNAARAEALLIAFASRRAIERGAPLGYLADQLRLRFGDARPNAVARVIAAGENPMTRDMLLARLDALAPRLREAPDGEGFFARIGREVSSAFVVRRENTPSPAGERRLERARMFLQTGRAADALTEVRNLPNAALAGQWIADAERYAAAQDALDLLETAAVLDERELRDADGARVVQPAE
jgi:hypothetical protein